MVYFPYWIGYSCGIVSNKRIKATTMGDVTVRYFKPSATDFAFTFNLAVEGYTDESTPSFTVVFRSTGEQFVIKEIYHSY
ncbi:hypothetical protein [Cohnella cholangitidis]|uniref:Uncharacterized protein n=1 Tax=Cohnella cholangitidis TaxID=2598458 RepID=A0A7G5C0P9_9BACL|nr:hypothetical protein [Cohnella cholangitidis]QMV42783.1 hypothetical protein FPL14_17500 [Cohnella cholangitidis]